MSSWMLLSIIIGVLGAYFCKYCWNLHRQFTLTAGMPSWTYLPIVGTAYKFFGNTELFFSRLIEATRMSETSDGRFRVWMGPQFLVLTSNTEDIKIISNSLIEKPIYYSFGKIWLGNGLVTAPGEIWKKNIKNLSGTFTGSIVDGFQVIFNSQATKLMNQLKNEAGRPPFDALHKYLAFATLETICQTALGVTNISGSIVTTEYYNAFNKALELLIFRGFNILHYPQMFYKLTPEYRTMKKNVKILHNVSNLVIAKKRKEWEENKNNGKPKTEDDHKVKCKTFLDVLLALSDNDPTLTDEQIRAEVDTIIVGGQETNATTLSFILLLLGSHPRVQDKLYSEIKQVFGDSKRAITKEDLSQLPYCEAVITETLRLYPPIPAVMRYADKDLPMSDYILPQGSIGIISIWGTGRSKKLWGENADEFIPERWLTSDLPTAAAFTPFSYGRRACIGRKYAITSLKTFLTCFIRELEFKSDISNLGLKCDIALRAIRGNLLEVRLRK